METEDKVQQKVMLIKEFWLLFSPLEELAKSDSTPDIRAYRDVFAKLAAGKDIFYDRVRKFATIGDVPYKHESNNIIGTIVRFDSNYQNLIDKAKTTDLDQFFNKFKTDLETVEYYIINQIDQIRVDLGAKNIQANTPFTAHICILNYMLNARKRLDYIDRYLNSDFFYLYLKNLDRSITIRLVTTEGNGKYSGVKNVKYISDLCRQEFKDYKLIQLDEKYFHDRYLRIDDMIFTIGTGVSKAGTYPTCLTIHDNSPQAHNEIDGLINNGIVIHQSP